MPRVWLISKRLRQDGFSAVEALLAATVFAMLVTGLTGALIYGRNATADAGVHNRATFLAEEGMEAARNIGNAAYTNLANGTYGLTQTGGIWTLSGTSDTSDMYTRQITVADAGANRKQVTSVVSWTQSAGGAANVTLTGLISNWEAATKSWPNGILAGGLDLSGTVDAIKVASLGNYAYVIRGSGAGNFAAVNVSDPTGPTLAGSLTLAGTPTNIAVSGNYAYVTNAGDTTEVQVVDISNPASPSLVRTLDLAGTANAQGVYISGNYAYVTRAFSTTTNSFELTVLNISTPTTPTVTGGYNHSSVGFVEVYVYNNYAYVTTSATNPMVLSINATTPTAPTLAGSYAPLLAVNTAPTIAGFGSTLFIGYGTTLDSISVATPSAPTRISATSVSLLGVINDIDVDSSGQYAFLATSNPLGEFMIYNVSNPGLMSVNKVIDLAGTINGVGYNSSLDIVAGATSIDNQEVQVFTKN